MANSGSGLDKQITRREQLIELFLVLLVLVGISFLISAHAVSAHEASVTGKAGATGLTGAVGPAGTAGTNGADGTQGLPGLAGARGTQGPTGANGAAGTNGSNGVAGTNGTNGTQGPTGPAGTFSDEFASNYYNDNAVTISPNGSTAIAFPTEAAHHGSDISINNDTITISQPGSYQINASGSLQIPSFEMQDGILSFDVVMQQSINSGPTTPVLPNPVAKYESVETATNNNNNLTQTFTVSRIVTVATAPTTFSFVVNNHSSYQSGGNLYLFSQMVNVIKLD